jgi:hypothetical protein
LEFFGLKWRLLLAGQFTGTFGSLRFIFPFALPEEATFLDQLARFLGSLGNNRGLFSDNFLEGFLKILRIFRSANFVRHIDKPLGAPKAFGLVGWLRGMWNFIRISL